MSFEISAECETAIKRLTLQQLNVFFERFLAETADNRCLDENRNEDSVAELYGTLRIIWSHWLQEGAQDLLARDHYRARENEAPDQYSTLVGRRTRAGYKSPRAT
jgi:hypothetical protein